MQEKENEKEKNSPLKILVCCHKPCTLPPDEDGVLLPVQVGAALTDKRFGFQTDNEVNGKPCDNISAKNESYCELTAMYWAWKNLKKIYPDVKYVGLFHYRRFFAFDERKFLEESINKNEEEINNYRVKLQKVISLMKKYDVILTAPRQRIYPASMEYRMSFVHTDYETLCDLVKKNFSDYYDDFIKTMEYSNKLSGRNMFIMKYEDFENYCTWLFGVLKILEEKVPLEHYHLYGRGNGIFGYVAEYLINVWVRKNKKKIKFCNAYFYHDDVTEKQANKFLAPFIFAGKMVGYLKNDLTAKMLTFGLRDFLKKFLIFKRSN